ncbi:DMT family transporter [Brenneria tiliae]|uniref:DMT family transporter n=1 Tax=Brenneria tiliae TaxID=2914984 RepID=UPI002014D47F|nr:DMT family transporter [Brenneria tiliae]MCL2897128.1 DMT family transporter [Brenneria tiliae]MCL2904781.1 DMT family transporter [Brenneria tiliae]
MKDRHTAYIELSLAMAIVGSLSVVGKKVITVFPVMLSSVLTLGIASVGMYLIHLWIVGKVPKITAAQFKYLFLQAFFGVVLFRVFFLYGLYWSSASMVGILIALTPVVIALLSIFLLREKVNFYVISWIFVSITGVIICQSSQFILNSGWSTTAGIALFLSAMICEGLFTVIRKKISYEPLNPITSNFYLCTIRAILFLPLGLYDLKKFYLFSHNMADWIPIIYTAVFVNIASFVLWFKGVDKIDATTVGIFTIVMPVTSTILSALILKEPITLSVMQGICIAIFGLLLVIMPTGKLLMIVNRHKRNL